ncbi:MAG: ArsR family transcriptional regulator, partial [Candidatus Thermoplasmatota archaeon]|nr:ArsR family transcriptional regulator [Candidatus Thermoplasmatota archaeon]
TGLANALGISVPVTSRHIKILEEVGLINKKVIGNVYILSANTAGFKKIFDPLIQEETITISNGESLFDALKQLPMVKIKKIGKNKYITEIDGEEGYYLYGVNGKKPEMPIDEFKPHKDVILELDKIMEIKKRKIKVKVKRTPSEKR